MGIDNTKIFFKKFLLNINKNKTKGEKKIIKLINLFKLTKKFKNSDINPIRNIPKKKNSNILSLSPIFLSIII